jgi:hypothetical protein
MTGVGSLAGIQDGGGRSCTYTLLIHRTHVRCEFNPGDTVSMRRCTVHTRCLYTVHMYVVNLTQETLFQGDTVQI